MLRRLIGELCRQLDFDMSIPDELRALRHAFADALRGAGARGRVVLVLDGLDKLEDQPGSLDLVWLPEAIPPDVRLVLSTRPERPAGELASREWPAFVVRPLDLDDRRRLIVEFLRPFGKELAPAQLERIAGAAACANPRFLRLLLEELRLHPRHETLPAWIDELLRAASIPDLYERILARWENDYDRGRDGLVRDALVRVWASRRGLSAAGAARAARHGGGAAACAALVAATHRGAPDADQPLRATGLRARRGGARGAHALPPAR